MKYSIVFLGAFLAATTLALPAPAAMPNPPTSAESLTLRDTSVQSTNDKSVVRKATKPADVDTDTDADTEGDPTDSDKSASDRDSNLGDTTDNGNRRKNRRALAVRRQMKRNARVVARSARDDASDRDTDGVDSSPSDDNDDSDSDGEKKRHLTRALRLRKARRSVNRSSASRDMRKRSDDTTDDEHRGPDTATDNDGVSTASENTTDDAGVDTTDDSD